MSQFCLLCFPPESSRIRGGNNAIISSWHAIERNALNSKGDLGSLYNARTDNVLISSSINKDSFVQKDVRETPTCRLIKVNAWNRYNMLKLIGIQDDLRISVALGMTTITEGTSMLHTYELPVDRTIRLIDYCRVDQEECLSNDITMVRKILSDTLPDNNATHIITSVRRGIDFVILLELPKNVNHNEIDSVLEKLCDYFLKSKAAFLSTEDEQKLNCLKPTIFTSITEIHSFSENNDLSVICQCINQYIYQNRSRSTLSYTLLPIKCVHYEKSANERIWRSLSPLILREIEEKLLPLSKTFTRIERLFQEKAVPQLSPDVKLCVDQTYKDICRVKNIFVEVQQALATKVDDVRRSTSDLSLRSNLLNETQILTLDSELKSLQTTVIELEKQVSCITKTETDHQTKNNNIPGSEDLNEDQANLEDTNILQPPTPFLKTRSLIKPTEINILLIGETGVGKSTLINAFVNYLAFHSLQQAANGEPIVLIPVSFLITIGNQFEEQKIEFGQSDANEDHNQSGQSVTQYCQSYIFTVANNIKLRIIDTPGIGDTRGIEQDKKNIDHILSYTSRLSHLNAICFLLKPNTTRLHIAFRSCFTQLFNFLGPNARENIIFCFTNTRATFYAPGDTAKLLRTMLSELPDDHKPRFTKENTFCFDSESFRYLTVIKSGCTLAFDRQQKQDFEQSWKMSVAESIRLLNLIKSRPEYAMNKWHSMKHAQMMIILLIRPILETIRNALRNLALWDLEKTQRIIELKAQSISLPGWLCTSCSYKVTSIDNIAIITRPIHNYRTANECDRCHCALSKHLPIFYQPQYQWSGTKGTGFYAEIKAIKDRLVYGSVILSQFSLYTTENSENPFLSWLGLFIEEQAHLSSKEPSSTINIELCKKLLEEKDAYVNGLQDIKRDDDRIKLDAVYSCIGEILAYSTIADQMNATKESQMKVMKNNEHDVSSQYPHIDNCL